MLEEKSREDKYNDLNMEYSVILSGDREKHNKYVVEEKINNKGGVPVLR